MPNPTRRSTLTDLAPAATQTLLCMLCYAPCAVPRRHRSLTVRCAPLINNHLSVCLACCLCVSHFVSLSPLRLPPRHHLALPVCHNTYLSRLAGRRGSSIPPPFIVNRLPPEPGLDGQQAHTHWPSLLPLPPPLSRQPSSKRSLSILWPALPPLSRTGAPFCNIPFTTLLCTSYSYCT